MENMRYLTFSLLACLFLVGCGGDSIQSELSKYSEENIQKATLLYTAYVSLNQYRGPDSAEQMVEFVQSSEEAKKRLEYMGIDVSKADDYLVGRDGEPLKFIWGLQKTPLSPAYPICYEQIGVDGVIQVGISGGKVHDCEDEDEVNEIMKQENYTAEEQKKYAPGISE
jgi:hypothetical protein